MRCFQFSICDHKNPRGSLNSDRKVVMTSLVRTYFTIRRNRVPLLGNNDCHCLLLFNSRRFASQARQTSNESMILEIHIAFSEASKEFSNNILVEEQRAKPLFRYFHLMPIIFCSRLGTSVLGSPFYVMFLTIKCRRITDTFQTPFVSSNALLQLVHYQEHFQLEHERYILYTAAISTRQSRTVFNNKTDRTIF